MKLFKKILFILLIIVAIAAFINYPKLNIISGYASKNVASNFFIANRSLESIINNDNNMPLIKLADTEIYKDPRAKASVFGLMERETICREGLGCVLINDSYNNNQNVLQPSRSKLNNELPFPYGNNGVADTLFSNIDYAQIETAIDKAFADSELQKTRTVLIAYKNQIIGERYLEGFTNDTPILGWSMTKSILATLFGILEYQGKIDTQYRPFKELDLAGLMGKDPREFLTLDDFLRMSSGLAWDEDYSGISDVTRMLFLDTDMSLAQINTDYDVTKPKQWNYSSGTSNMLSGILRQQFESHQDYLDFPYKALIDKIGMHSMLIETDMAGNFVGSSYGWANTRDWAKFGLLHLNKGNWKGEQLFAPEWVDYISKPTELSKGVYGAHWWLNSAGRYPDVPQDLYSANGFQGQYVFVIPSKELVIVRTGLGEEPDFRANDFLKEVIAAIK